MPPISVQSGPCPWAAGWELSARVAVLSPGLCAAGPGAELGGGPALLLADLCCHLWQNWSPDREFRQRWLLGRPSPRERCGASCPLPLLAWDGVLRVPLKEQWAELVRDLPHGPPIPSPGSVSWDDTKQVLQTQMLLAGVRSLRLGGQQVPHLPPKWVLGAIPPAWSSPAPRDSLATYCWGCKSHQHGLWGPMPWGPGRQPQICQ